MKISKKSWHYKFHNRYYGKNDESRSLCSYVRKIIIALILCIPIEIINFTGNYIPQLLEKRGKETYIRLKKDDGIFCFEFILNMIIYYTIYASILSTLYFYIFSWNGTINGIEMFSMITQATALICLVAYIIVELQYKYKEDTLEKKKENVVWEYIKAKYRKICPLTEYVD